MRRVLERRDGQGGSRNEISVSGGRSALKSNAPSRPPLKTPALFAAPHVASSQRWWGAVSYCKLPGFRANKSSRWPLRSTRRTGASPSPPSTCRSPRDGRGEPLTGQHRTVVGEL